jgi:hypothetical protein
MRERVMAQNRKPPAFQEYAATILSSKSFRVMSLSQRGLLFTMRLECWVNQSIPSLSNELARYLGLNNQEVLDSLSANVISYFNESEGLYICPELEDYRQHIREQREKQRAGGRKAAAITNNKWKETNSANPQVTSESLVQLSPVKLSSNQSLERGNIDDDFVRDYESASNGI